MGAPVVRRLGAVCADGKGRKAAKNTGRDEMSDIFKLVKMIIDRRYDPVGGPSLDRPPAVSLCCPAADSDDALVCNFHSPMFVCQTRQVAARIGVR